MNTATEPQDAINRMFTAGAHYGLTKARRHPSTRDAIFGTKFRSDIIDLEKTQSYLRAAKEFVRMLGRERKVLMFVGGKPESHHSILNAAQELEIPYCVGRWIGGTLTNFSEIKKRVNLLQKLRADKESGALAKYTKFERLQIDREVEKLQSMYAGLVALKEKLPHALFVIDPRREAIAVEEAAAKRIPVIAVANTDCDLAAVAYPIPANDAAPKSIALFVDEIAAAYKEGLAEAPQAPAGANAAPRSA